jgi:hypothetical protein
MSLEEGSAMNDACHRALGRTVGTGLLLTIAFFMSPLASEGRDFSQLRRLSHSSGNASEPQLATSATSVYVVWTELNLEGCCTNGDGDVFLAKSDDSGQTFSRPMNLSEAVGAAAQTPRIQAAADEHTVYVVWSDNNARQSGTGSQIFFTRSTDGGASFSPPINLSNGIDSSLSPEIAQGPNGDIYVVWLGGAVHGGIFFIRSIDAGATFSAPQNLSSPGPFADHGQIAVDGLGSVHVVWEEQVGAGNFDIIHRRSVDGGLSFLAAQNLTGNPGISFAPRMQTFGTDTVYVVWQEEAGGILASTSTDGGASFSGLVTVGGSVDARDPVLAVGLDGAVHVAWADGDVLATSVLSSHSADGGATFSDPVVVDSSMEYAFLRRIAVGGTGSLFVVWEGVRVSNVGKNQDVFFGESDDGGTTFTSQNLTLDKSVSSVGSFAGWPNVTAGAGYVFVTWVQGPARSQTVFTRSAE